MYNSEEYHLPKTKRRQLKNTFQDYCEGSSLHGIKYLVASDRPWIERIWWFLATALSFVGSIYLISRVYVKWHNSPVIVSFAESTTSVWQIPFPAVTICSETKSRQSIFNYTWYHHKTNSSELSEEELIKREVIALTCDQHITNEGNEHLDPQALDYLEELGSPFEEVTWYCNWKDVMVNCSELFTPIMTDEGICFTSNTLSHDDFFDGDGLNSKYLKDLPAATNWNLERGYKDHAKLETYPRRALGSGKKSSLTVVMRAYNKDLDYICRGAVQGFKVLLHNPAEIPRVAERYFRAPLSQEVVLAVKPDMMTTSQTLLDYSPERRQCFFPHERKLAYFKVYTQRNCELECLTNFTFNQCGCVSYFMPRSNSTPICGTEMKKCTGKVNEYYENTAKDLQKNIDKIPLLEQENSIVKIKEKMVYQEIKASLDREKNPAAGSCNCLISCTSIQYEAETSQADYNWDKLFIAYKTNMSDPELQGVNLARVSIYYKDNQFITSHRNELYGYADFLAGCGGLLGLCSGFSLLSLVEIIYYATIRLFNNMRQDRKLNDTPKKKMLKLAE